MFIVSARFLACAPAHAAAALIGSMALLCGLWSIPTTVNYAVSKPCTVYTSTPETYVVATSDCSSCIEAPPTYLGSPPCASAQPTDIFCLGGFKCCNVCCDICTSKGTSFQCNCICCSTVNENLCSVTPSNTTVFRWQGVLDDMPLNTTQPAPPPGALPWHARCVMGPDGLTWIPEHFPSEVWIVPTVWVTIWGGVIAVWARRRAHTSRLARRPTIFSTELTIQKPQVRSSLSSALFSIRQEANSTAKDASSSSGYTAMPIPNATLVQTVLATIPQPTLGDVAPTALRVVEVPKTGHSKPTGKAVAVSS
jgi:hypothetical protein